VENWQDRLKEKNRKDRFKKIYQQLISLNPEELKGEKLFSTFMNYKEKENEHIKKDLQRELEEVQSEIQFVSDLATNDRKDFIYELMELMKETKQANAET
jgi:hypothetical protein